MDRHPEFPDAPAPSYWPRRWARRAGIGLAVAGALVIVGAAFATLPAVRTLAGGQGGPGGTLELLWAHDKEDADFWSNTHRTIGVEVQAMDGTRLHPERVGDASTTRQEWLRMPHEAVRVLVHFEGQSWERRVFLRSWETDTLRLDLVTGGGPGGDPRVDEAWVGTDPRAALVDALGFPLGVLALRGGAAAAGMAHYVRAQWGAWAGVAAGLLLVRSHPLGWVLALDGLLCSLLFSMARDQFRSGATFESSVLLE